MGPIFAVKERLTIGIIFKGVGDLLERLSLTLRGRTSNGKRQTAKMKLLPSVVSSLNSRVKIFVFGANSRRHFSIFM